MESSSVFPFPIDLTFKDIYNKICEKAPEGFDLNMDNAFSKKREPSMPAFKVKEG